MSGSSCEENSPSRTRQLCVEMTLDHAQASSQIQYTFVCRPCLARLVNSGNTPPPNTSDSRPVGDCKTVDDRMRGERVDMELGVRSSAEGHGGRMH